MDRSLRFVLIGLLILWITFLSIFNLEGAPPLWWDEGWTLTAARNWLERGHYGPYLDGQPAARGMEGAFTYTVPIAAVFHIFGVGVFQGRFVQVLFTLSTLALVGYMAWRFYGASVAVAALAILTLMPAYPSLHPVILGRQVLGEAPAFFYLMAGYACLLMFIPGRELLAGILAVVFWSLAINTKTQILPFWAVSIVVPLACTLYYKRWRLAVFIAMLLVMSIAGAELAIAIWSEWIKSQTVPRVTVTGMYEAIATGGTLPARLFSLISLVIFGLPTLIGLSAGVWRFLSIEIRELSEENIVKLSILALATSWFAWYLLLSVGWIRYLFPATLLASIFLAKLLADLTNQFDASITLNRVYLMFSRCKFTMPNVGAFLTILIIFISVPRGMYMLYRVYVVEADVSVKEAAEFLNTYTPPDALVESYDSELFFYLNRRYHFPGDQLHVDLIRRTFLYEQNRRIDYDPLASNPDYLVVGPQTKQWRLYDAVVKSGTFRLIRSYARYQVYERVR